MLLQFKRRCYFGTCAGLFYSTSDIDWLTGPTPAPLLETRSVFPTQGSEEDPVYGCRTKRNGHGLYLISLELPAEPAVEILPLKVSFSNSICGKMLIMVESGDGQSGLFSSPYFCELKTFTRKSFFFPSPWKETSYW